MRASLRLTVIADLHLDAGAPAGLELLGKRGLSLLSWRLRRRALHRDSDAAGALAAALAAPADAMLALGDLANFGLAREAAAAAGSVRAAAGDRRVLAVPGNHDAMAPGWEAPLRAAWGSWLPDPAFPWVARLGPAAVFGVSTASPSPPFFASGRVGADQRARLREGLARAGREGLARIVALHHPPTALAPRRKALADAAALRETLLAAGAELVLHGHLHRATLSWIGEGARRIPAIGAPSLSAGPDRRRGGDGTAAGGWLTVELGAASGRMAATVTPTLRGADGRLRAGTPLVFALPAAGLGSDARTRAG